MEENTPFQSENKTGRGLTIVLLIIVLVLAAVSGVLYSKLGDTREESAEVQVILENQKVSLESELTNLQQQFGALQTNNDTLKVKVIEKQERIEKLLKINASNVQKIQLYQKELGTLREVLKSYIAQVDSLNTRNIALTRENRNVRSQLQEVTSKNQELQQEQVNLSSKVEKASVIGVADVNATGLNNRGKEADRLRTITQIRVCCTVRANAVVSAGERTVYLRILDPSGNLLRNPDGNTFTFRGETIGCSAYRVISYDNQDLPICIYWDKDASLTTGTYRVELYIDGNLVGNTSLLIR